MLRKRRQHRPMANGLHGKNLAQSETLCRDGPASCQQHDTDLDAMNKAEITKIRDFARRAAGNDARGMLWRSICII
jgi:hypothetical protein